jgi:hypothetical protein
MARLPRPRLAFLIGACLLLIPLEGLGVSAAPAPFGFSRPVYVTSGPLYQAAEPSIRVDASDPNHRIWVTAPTSIGVDSRSLPGGGTQDGDLFWYSDNNGATWTVKGSPGPTIVGGGDSDVITGSAGQVYGTGLTLANITLAGSCDNGTTFATNPISNIGAVEDRQWIDMYEDRPKPASGPDFVLTYGGIAERKIWFHQVASACPPGSPVPSPPVAGPRISATFGDPNPAAADRYQWPGNIAVDENTGDVYVTYNTIGSPDKVIVTRIDNGAEVVPTNPVTDVHPVAAAANRPNTFDSFTVAAVDSASNVYVVWTERIPSEQGTDTMLAVSKDRGQTWSAPITVNRLPETHTTVFPWIAAGGPGRISIVYYATSAAGPSPETVPNTSLWRVWMAKSVDATAATPTFREVPATGFMHQGSICTSGTGCAAGTRDLLDFFMVDLDEEGLANIAYTDNLNTPPQAATPTQAADAHQEWITFVQECRVTSRRTSIPCRPAST